MFNYEVIKRLAKDHKMKVNDLLALAPQNDPFYTGSKAQIRDAEWVADLYSNVLDSPRDVHIRRIHYRLISDDTPKPDGTLYQNTQNDWQYLVNACKYARYLDLIPADNFIDRRNPDPEINAEYWQNEEHPLDELDVDSVLNQIASGVLPYNPQLSQAYHLEMWCEKSTINDVLIPIGNEFNANIVTGMGELSITAVDDCVKRVVKGDRPARIFYISDFDPAGENMPVSVARKLEYYSRKYDDIPNIRLKHLVLTKDQCVEYKLPRTPIKDTDKRKDGFEERHGEGATELDALEALRPGELRKLIIEALSPYFDKASYGKVVSENWNIRAALRSKLKTEIKQILDNLDLDLDDFDFPISKPLKSESDDFLLDTSRDYVDQLVEYKAHKSPGIDAK